MGTDIVPYTEEEFVMLGVCSHDTTKVGKRIENPCLSKTHNFYTTNCLFTEVLMRQNIYYTLCPSLLYGCFMQKYQSIC